VRRRDGSIDYRRVATRLAWSLSVIALAVAVGVLTSVLGS
jgi:hypothetical protein